MVLVGFGSHRGTVIAGDEWGAPMEAMPVPPAREGSWEDVLHRAAAERRCSCSATPTGRRPCRWRSAGTAPSAWSTTPSYERWGNYVPDRAARRYDAFLYFDETTALHPLPALTTFGELATYPAGV